MTVLLAQSHPTAEAGEALRIRKQDLAKRKFDRCWTASTDEQIIADVGLYRQRRLDAFFFGCAMNRLPHAAVQVLRALPEKSCDIVRPQ